MDRNPQARLQAQPFIASRRRQKNYFSLYLIGVAYFCGILMISRDFH